jgi:hypothetical protein
LFEKFLCGLFFSFFVTLDLDFCTWFTSNVFCNFTSDLYLKKPGLGNVPYVANKEFLFSLAIENLWRSSRRASGVAGHNSRHIDTGHCLFKSSTIATMNCTILQHYHWPMGFDSLAVARDWNLTNSLTNGKRLWILGFNTLDSTTLNPIHLKHVPTLRTRAVLRSRGLRNQISYLNFAASCSPQTRRIPGGVATLRFRQEGVAGYSQIPSTWAGFIQRYIHNIPRHLL